MELLAKIFKNRDLLAELNATFTSQNTRQSLIPEQVSVVPSIPTSMDSLAQVFAQQQTIVKIQSNVMTLEGVLKEQIDFLNLIEEVITMVFQKFNNTAGLEKKLEV